MKKIFLLFAALLSIYACVYHAHRDLSLLAIEKRSPKYFNELRSEARVGYEFRLTETVIDATQSIEPQKLDYIY